MALMDFIKKQFIDIIQWTEDGDGTLAWRFPMRDMEIQYGASLTVRESQMAVFVNEGKVADVFGPGMYKLTTQTIPVLTYLKNWDKLFESPFKSDVYFFSTRQQIDQRWGTPQPITIRDKDFGAVRLRAFGNYAYRIADPKAFHTEDLGHARRLHGGRARRPAARPVPAAHLGRDRRERHPVPRPGGQPDRVRQGAVKGADAAFAELGLQLDLVTVQNLSLPEELQKILDQRIGMGMVGNDMGKFMQYQTGAGHSRDGQGRRRGRRRHRRRCDGPGRRHRDGPGAGAEPAEGPAGRPRAADATAAAAAAGEARRRDGHAGKTRRAQGQGHPDAGRVRRQEGGAAQEARRKQGENAA